MKGISSIRFPLCVASCATMAVLAYCMGWPYTIGAFATITVTAITLWITDAMPGTIVAMLLPPLYILLKVGSPPQILSPWSSSMCWLVLGGVIISRMMEKNGISKRIALWALNISGTSLNRLFWGITLAGFIIAPFVPTAMGKAALLVVILGGICKTLRLEPGSREASCIFLCGLLVLACPKFIFFTASVDSAMLVNTARHFGLEITWLDYFRANALPGLVYALLCVFLLVLFAPRLKVDFSDYVREEYKNLGSVTMAEKKSCFLLVGIAVAMITDSWHGLDIGWLMMLGAGACFLPGVSLLDAEDIRQIPLGVVFFVAGCMCIGSAAHASGMDAIIATTLGEYFHAEAGASTFAGAFASGVLLNLGLTTLPAITTTGPALTGAALASGTGGTPLLYSFLWGLDQFVLPYVFAPALYFYASGYLAFRHYFSFQLLKLALAAIFLLIIAIPWWLTVFGS